MDMNTATIPHIKGMRVLQMIWGAMIFSVGVYAAVAWFVRTGLRSDVDRFLTVAMLSVSMGLFIVQVKLHRNLSDERLFPRILDLGSWGLRPEVARQLQGLPVPERGVQLIFQAHLIFGILIWSMAEAVAVFGLLLSLFSGDPRLMALFGSVALAELIRFRPKGEAFEQQIKRWRRYVETNRGKWEETSTQDTGRGTQ